MINTPIPSVGIIMDGNRRWAASRGLPSVAGHKEGVEVIKRLAKDVVRLEKEYGLKYVTLFTFSTENWSRSPEEVRYLMNLIETEFARLVEHLAGQNIRVRIVGDTRAFSEPIQKVFADVEEKTKNNSGVTVAFALSYGGRAEIINATNQAIKEGKPVDEETFAKLLYTNEMADPDIVIRTGGEQRLSGFLPWQAVYSELFFTEDFWPDFTTAKLEMIFKEYKERERRHGK